MEGIVGFILIVLGGRFLVYLGNRFLLVRILFRSIIVIGLIAALYLNGHEIISFLVSITPSLISFFNRLLLFLFYFVGLPIFFSSLILGLRNSISRILGRESKFLEAMIFILAGSTSFGILGWALSKAAVWTTSGYLPNNLIGFYWGAIVGAGISWLLFIYGNSDFRKSYLLFHANFGMIVGGSTGAIVARIYDNDSRVWITGGIKGIFLGGIAAVSASLVFKAIARGNFSEIDNREGMMLSILNGWIAIFVSGILAGLPSNIFFLLFLSFVLSTLWSTIGGYIIFQIGTPCLYFSLFLVRQISKFFSIFLSRVLILLNHSEIMCAKCLRYASSLRSKYELGIRKCEYCNQVLDKTRKRGKVIFSFGKYRVPKGVRKFIFSNPNFENKDSHIDVSEVYIDTKTVDKRLLEKFITYIRNYPPKYGLDSVRIFYQGQLDDLSYLKNSIINNFRKVREI